MKEYRFFYAIHSRGSADVIDTTGKQTPEEMMEQAITLDFEITEHNTGDNEPILDSMELWEGEKIEALHLVKCWEVEYDDGFDNHPHLVEV